MLLTLDTFEKIADVVYRQTGLRYETKKMYFLSKRIEKRATTLGLATLEDYVKILKYSDPRGQELQSLIELLTVNETYFFRDFRQLTAFAEHCLEEVAQKKRIARKKRIRIWSAGCSTGEEPYTLGIILREMLEDFSEWDITILATDIDRNVVNTAKKRCYSKTSLRDVPSEYLRRYFMPGSNGDYKLCADFSPMINFEYLNLMDKTALRQHQGFDFIFCRNVLIYFDEVSRKQVVDHFYMALNPGGFVFLGSSESVGQINTAFKVKRTGDHLVYYRE
ncbi:MAG: protein-glutamate O-methyltransferase CheR [Pseudomonadota bacterium]